MMDEQFLKISRRQALAGAAIAALPMLPQIAAARTSSYRSPAGWAKNAMRWFQLAFVEDDPGNFDPKLWLDFFARSRIDTVVLSAGGFDAFYPTRIPLHHRAPGVDRSDAFGTMVEGCRSLGINIVARIEPQGAREDVIKAHPEWIMRTADGKPVRDPGVPDLWMTCTLGPYNFDFMTRVVQEIATRYRPDAFFGNRWMQFGLCYCDSCRTEFRAASGMEIPTAFAGDNPAVPAYQAWERKRLFELVGLWNRTMQAINPHSFFMPNGAGVFPSLPLEVYGPIAPALASDHQGRHGTTPVWASGRDAKYLRSGMGDATAVGICGLNVNTPERFKDSVNQMPEIRAWIASSVAQGARPWIVKFNAKPVDKRWMPGVEALYQDLQRRERYLRNRENLARIAILTSSQSRWSQVPPPTDLDTGLDHERGWYQALLEARLPFELALDTRLGEAAVNRFRLLILPNITHLSDRQCRAIEDYVRNGGRIVATYETSLYDERGRKRDNFGLAELFGCSVAGASETKLRNNYLTLRHPHPLGRGLEGTPQIIGVTRRVPVQVHGGVEAPLTWVPTYPSLPMERLIAARPETDMPMAVCSTYGKGRVVFMPMDVDRTYWDIMAADHGLLLRNAIEWAAEEEPPVKVDGPGLVEIAYWRQEKSLTLHLVNLNNSRALRGLTHSPVASGPWRAAMRLPSGAAPRAAVALEGGGDLAMEREGDWLIVELPSILEHEIVAIDLA